MLWPVSTSRTASSLYSSVYLPRPLALFEGYGFRPQIVQEASHWLTILNLVGAGLGVSVAPACVRRIASPEVVCIPFRGARVVSTIELARLVGDVRPIVERFAQVAADVLTA